MNKKLIKGIIYAVLSLGIFIGAILISINLSSTIATAKLEQAAEPVTQTIVQQCGKDIGICVITWFGFVASAMMSALNFIRFFKDR